MTKRLRFDDQIEKYLNNRIIELRNLGIKRPSKPDALRTIIEENRIAQLKLQRKRRSRGIIFK